MKGQGSPGMPLSRAHRSPSGRGSCSAHRCPGRARWARVCSLCHSPRNKKMVEGWECGKRQKAGKHCGSSWMDRWGTQAHLAGRATITRWAGTLFYFPGWVLACVLRHSHIHADTREPGYEESYGEAMFIEHWEYLESRAPSSRGLRSPAVS